LSGPAPSALAEQIDREADIAERRQRLRLAVVELLAAEDVGQDEHARARPLRRIVIGESALERAAGALMDDALADDGHRRLLYRASLSARSARASCLARHWR
jgi:hypothetical protein